MNLHQFKLANKSFHKSVRLFQRTFFLVPVFALTFTASSSTEFYKAWQYTFNFEFQKADSVIQTFAVTTFEYNSVPFLEFKQKFFRLITNGSNDEILHHQTELKQLLNRQKSLKNKLPTNWYNYYLSEMHLYNSFLFGRINDNWQAFKHFSAAKNHAEKALSEDVSFPPALKVLGVIELLESAIPLQYNSLARFFGFKGNSESGFNKLYASYKLSSERLKTNQNEALFYLLYAASNTSNKIRIDDYLNSLSLDFESPALKLAFLTYVKGKSNWINEKERVFDEVTMQDYARLPYLALLKTDYLLGKKEFSAALLMLNLFKQRNKVNGFACRIIQRVYWINLLEEKALNKDFLHQMRAASKNSEDDVQAELELIHNFNYDRNLLLARILFDEGRINQSFEALINADSTSSVWNTKEYQYRKGRLLYQNNQLSQALQRFNYVQTLSKLTDLDYFGAYSCYYSAEIQYKTKNNTAALGLIKKAESYQQHAYVKSLGARIAYLLKQIKNDSPSKK